MKTSNARKEPSCSTARQLEKERVTRKAYAKPTLRELGDVRGVTLGGSPGAGESGFTTLFKP